MRKLFILFSFFLSSTILFSQVKMEWSVRYNGRTNKEDQSTGIVVDKEGNVFISGYTNISGSDLDFLTIKYTPNGKQKWLRTYGTPKTVWGVSMDQAHAIALDHEENIYVTGWSSGNVRTDYATLKYNQAGKKLWVTTYTGKMNLNDEAYWIALDNVGNVYVTGWSFGQLPTSRDQLTTIKYNPLGKEQWTFIFDEKADMITQPRFLRTDHANNVYVVGGSADFSGGEFDYSIVKIDSNGTLKWSNTYDGPGNDHDMAECVDIDLQGNVYVTGVSTTQKRKGREIFATIKYNPMGEKKWEAIYAGPTDKAQCAAIRLGLDQQGNVYVGGSVRIGRKENIAIVAYNSTGNQKWASIYSGPENYDKIQDMVVSKKGNVYITGSSEGSGTDNDLITIKYDINGNKIWDERFNGPKNANDYGTAICIDQEENVYVTGIIKAKRGRDDIITIKYSQKEAN